MDDKADSPYPGYRCQPGSDKKHNEKAKFQVSK